MSEPKPLLMQALGAVSSIQSRVDEARQEARQCPICWDKAKDCALVPCGHAVCHDCAEGLRQCPTCRAPIQSRVRLFM